MKKKILSFLLIASVVCGFCGCGGVTINIPDTNEGVAASAENIQEEQKSEASEEDNRVEEIAQSEETLENNPEQTEDEETEDVLSEDVQETEEAIEEVVEVTYDLENISSPEFADLLDFGWNLGNTLDANDKTGLESETCWGQPKVTPELIAYVKEVGFTTIRIPVSWGNHTDDDYNIDPEWMARVKEIVDYAYDAGLFVIINSHHDCDYYYPSPDNYDNASRYLSTIWTQIAEEFKDYDNMLVFESMNEPRLKGTDIEWWFAMNNQEGKDAITTISKLNQVFVDVVRNSGGNNANRFIMVPSYAANPEFATYKEFVMPEDPANRLLLSVHAYTPYDFAMNPNGYKDWDGSKTYEFNFMGKLKAEFINQGYGVVIGEFGATNKGNDVDRSKWARGYCMKAESFGIPCIVWDNGAVGIGEENFGVIDRKNLQLSFPDVFEAYLGGYVKLN